MADLLTIENLGNLMMLIFLQAVAFFYRSFLEWKEGEESAGKYLADIDSHQCPLNAPQ